MHQFVVRQMQGCRLAAGQLTLLLDELLLVLLLGLLNETVRPGVFPAGAANGCQLVPLHNLLDLVRVRLVIVQSARHTLQPTVFQYTPRSAAHLVDFFRVIVAAPILFVALATVAVVHVSVEHQTRRRPGALDEDQLVAICGI